MFDSISFFILRRFLSYTAHRASNMKLNMNDEVRFMWKDTFLTPFSHHPIISVKGAGNNHEKLQPGRPDSVPQIKALTSRIRSRSAYHQTWRSIKKT